MSLWFGGKTFPGCPHYWFTICIWKKLVNFLLKMPNTYTEITINKKIPQLKNQSDTARLTPTFGKLFFHIKKQNIHKYILKESVVSNLICQVLYLATSLLKKKRSTQYLRMNAREKKRKTYFCTPHMSRPAAFNKKKQTTNVAIICPIQWVELNLKGCWWVWVLDTLVLWHINKQFLHTFGHFNDYYIIPKTIEIRINSPSSKT